MDISISMLLPQITIDIKEVENLSRVRMTIEMPPKIRKILDDLAVEKETDLSKIIRSSILLFNYLDKEVKNGAKIKVNDKEVIFPEFLKD